jgi:hypothetical protein
MKNMDKRIHNELSNSRRKQRKVIKRKEQAKNIGVFLEQGKNQIAAVLGLLVKETTFVSRR